MSDSPEEIKLIKAAQQDIRAFEAVYIHYHDRIFGYVWQKLRDSETTADITSEVFVKAMLHIKRFEIRGIPFSAWLFRVAANEVNQYFRKTGNVRHVSVHPELRSEWDMYWEAAEMRLQLEKILSDLAVNERQLLEWRFFDGFTFKEIAAMESSTEAAVKMKVYRILETLKSQLK